MTRFVLGSYIGDSENGTVELEKKFWTRRHFFFGKNSSVQNIKKKSRGGGGGCPYVTTDRSLQLRRLAGLGLQSVFHSRIADLMGAQPYSAFQG